MNVMNILRVLLVTRCVMTTRHVLYISGVAEKNMIMIFQMMAAILHLGNVKVLEAEGDASTIEVRL